MPKGGRPLSQAHPAPPVRWVQRAIVDHCLQDSPRPSLVSGTRIAQSEPGVKLFAGPGCLAKCAQIVNHLSAGAKTCVGDRRPDRPVAPRHHTERRVAHPGLGESCNQFRRLERPADLSAADPALTFAIFLAVAWLRLNWFCAEIRVAGGRGEAFRGEFRCDPTPASCAGGTVDDASGWECLAPTRAW